VRRSLVIGLSVMLVLGTVSLAIGFVDINNEEEFKSEDGARYQYEENYHNRDENYEILGKNIREEAALRSENELIEVMIRLSPNEFEDKELLRTPLNEVNTGRVTTELKEHSERKQSDVIDFLDRGSGEVLNTFWIANAILAEVEVGALDELVGFDQVWKIHENFEVSVQGAENFYPTETQTREGKEIVESPYHYYDEVDQKTEKINFERIESSSDDITWGLDRINTTDVWQRGRDGSGVRIAVSDSGVDIDHPDLEGKMVTVDEDDPHHPGGWIEFDMYGEVVEDSIPHDTHGHGTHTLGTVLGGNASGTHIGVAPGADLMHALTLPDNVGYLGQLIAGMEWKVEPHDRNGMPLHEKYGGRVEDYRAHIASMSWGTQGDEHLDLFIEPVQNLRNAGVVPIAVLGNDGEGTFWIPGAVYEAFGVGATDRNDDIADFSGGAIIKDERDDTPDEFVKPDFAAPGVDVMSSLPGEEWGYWQGTSMAVPHVAGTVALMLHPSLSIDEIYDALKETAEYYEAGDDLGGDKNTRYGYGIINADKAFEDIGYYLDVREAESITNQTAVLGGNLFEMPNDEAEVFFRYRPVREDDWSETDSKILTDTGEFEIDVGELESGTAYEYKAVGEWTEKQNVTFTETFTTHRDAEIFTLPEENLTPENVTLRGEVTRLYLDEVKVSFRYREVGDDWSEIEVGNISEPQEFSAELEELRGFTPHEYKAVSESDEEEFIGDIIRFIPPAPEPEWNDDQEAYLISNAPDLQWMKNDLENDYIIVDDIDASETEEWFHGKGFEPIGKSNRTNAFEGTLYGRNHSIENLYISREGEDVGLFAGLDGRVTDVKLIDAEVKGERGAIIVGGINTGKILNSYATGFITGERRLGGLVGNNLGEIINSSAMVDVTGQWELGGLVGNNLGEIVNSSSTGDIAGRVNIGGLAGLNRGRVLNSSTNGKIEGNFSGGLVGNNRGEIENSTSTAEIIGNSTVGGLVGIGGSILPYYDITLRNSYFQGEVTGEAGVGGLVGYQRQNIINNSHYNIDEVLINGEHRVTQGGLFDDQYQDWIENKELDIEDYDTLKQVDDHYEISGVQGIRDLLGFAADGEKEFYLSNDIDLSDEPGLHIPYIAADFDGDGHTISNLHIDHPFADYIGLFGYNDNGTLKNLDVIESYVRGRNHVGVLSGHNGRMGVVTNSSVVGEVIGEMDVGTLVGFNSNKIENSSAAGKVTGETVWRGLSAGTGGLVGRGRGGGTVMNSSSTADVTGNYHVGGLLGRNRNSIHNSYATGNVRGELNVGGLVGEQVGSLSGSYATGDVSGENRVGGLVGRNPYGEVNNSYSMGNVEGNESVGGLVGGNRAQVINSYSIGKVSGDSNIGGLIGNNTGTVENFYWDIENSGIEESDGGTGRTSDEMTGERAETNMEGFDFDDIWEKVTEDDEDAGENGYPILQGLDRKTQLEAQGIFDEVEEEEDKTILDRILDLIDIPERPEVPDREEIPGFTTTIVVLALMVALVIHHKKRLEKN